MRLKSIELYDNFRSLKSGFKLEFIKEPPTDKNSIEPYCVVGRNGSGKSNILELLSAIFYQIEISCLDYKPKEVVTRDDEEGNEYEEREYLSIFESFSTEPNAFKLEYYIFLDDRETLVTIEKEADKYRKIYLDGDSKNSLEKKELQDKERTILPEHIIGYSSGQNEILSLSFYKMRLIQHDEYIDNYLGMDTPIDSHESRMIYLDDVFSQAIFITNFIYADDKVNKIFKETIGVESVESFRIVIRHKAIAKVPSAESDGVEKDEKFLIEQVNSQIEKLKSCSSIYHYKDKDIPELYLDFYLDDTIKDAFHFHFGEGKVGRLKLFQTFQILINLNYFNTDESIKLKFYKSDSLYAKGYLPQNHKDNNFFGFKYFNLKKTGIKDTVLSKSLSDGEYQFLHSIGLSLIYRDTQSLFLLDEPETHFNPSWRAEYMSVLKECFSGTKTKAEFLITSHSPFIVSDTHKEKVLIFEKEKGKVNIRKPSFNTFGASSNKITIEIFDKEETIGKVAENKVDEFNKKIKNSKDLEKLMRDVEKELGDSMEKVLLLQRIIKQKEGKK